jgi:hypothetical protein
VIAAQEAMAKAAQLANAAQGAMAKVAQQETVAQSTTAKTVAQAAMTNTATQWATTDPRTTAARRSSHYLQIIKTSKKYNLYAYQFHSIEQ